MPLCFGSETLHQKDDDETAEDRGKKHPVAKAAGSLAYVCVVPDAQGAVVKRVVKQADQRSQCDGAATRHDTDDQCEAAKNQEAGSPLRPCTDRRNGGIGRRDVRERHIRHNPFGRGQPNRRQHPPKSMNFSCFVLEPNHACFNQATTEAQCRSSASTRRLFQHNPPPAVPDHANRLPFRVWWGLLGIHEYG